MFSPQTMFLPQATLKQDPTQFSPQTMFLASPHTMLAAQADAPGVITPPDTRRLPHRMCLLHADDSG